MGTHFSPAASSFLKGLARHNERPWFDQRKPIYETELKQPMFALIAEINAEMADFAPDYVRDPHKCMMRIYRDVRFSKDKRPYKTNVAAWWPRHGLEKTSGGGFYLEISPAAVRIAAGAYMPERDQLLAIRRMLVDRHEEVRAALKVAAVKPPMVPLEGRNLVRSPQGFSPDSPAADLIQQQQWGLISTLPGEAMLSPGLLANILKRFRMALPLLSLLNTPLLPASKRPLF